MAVGESAGSVFVTIDGDVTPLLAKYGYAETASRAAGQRIAQSLGTGLNAGTGLVDQYGRAISSGIGKPLAAADPVVRKVATSIRQAGAEAEATVPKMAAASAAIRTGFGEQSVRAVERFVSTIPGVGAALQAIFPVVGALALVEMLGKVFEKSEKVTEAEKAMADANKQADDAFLHMAQTIDTLAAKDIGRVFGPAAGAAAEIRAMELQKDDLYKDLQKAKDQLGALATEAQGKILKRPTAGSLIEEEYKPKFEEAGKAIEAAQSKVTEFEARIKDARAQAAELAKTESGSLSAIEISNTEKSAERRAEAARSGALARIKAEHDVREATIEADDNAYSRELAIAADRVTTARQTASAEIAAEQAVTKAKIDGINARAAAESRGKPQSEVQKIQTTAGGEVSAAREEGAQKGLEAMRAADAAEAESAKGIIELNRKVAETLNNEVAEGWNKVAIAARDAGKVNAEIAAKDIDTKTRVSEVQDKSRGEVAALQVEQQKIALEREYSLQVGHTGARQVAQARAIAQLNAQERADKLAGLQAELLTAQAEDSSMRDETKIATLTAEIAKLKQENANADAKDAATIDEMNQKLTKTLSLQQQISSMKASASNTLQQNNQTAGAQFGQAIGNLPKDVGDDIGSSISDALLGHHPGESIGKAMAHSLEDSLKQTLGGILKQALSSVFQIGLSFLGFADGTSSAPGGVALVGEKGPELVNLPRGSQVIPNHRIMQYATGTPGYSSTTHYQSTSFQTGSTELHFHAHGMNNPDKFIDHVMRKLPEALKRRSSAFAPLSH